jgi:hypothetical protein
MSFLDRLSAEALAWPLACEAAFHDGTSTLDETALLRTFAARAAGLGQLPFYADTCRHVWRAASTGSRPLNVLDLLVVHARRLLVDQGEHCALRADGGDLARATSRWRWISLRLPPYLLVAAASAPGVRATLDLRLLPASVAPPGPLAHLHLHLGACHTFELLWANLARNLDIAAVRTDTYAPLGGGPAFSEWLAAAFVVRRHLAEQLLGTPFVGRTTLDNRLLNDAIAQLRHGTIRQRPLHDRRLLRLAQHEARPCQRARTMEQVWHNDPIANPTLDTQWPEGRLLQALFHRRERDDLRHLGVQYLRIKTALYRHLVADPAAPGLEDFVQRYSRISRYEAGLEIVTDRVPSTDTALPGLAAIEPRVGPPKTIAAALDLAVPMLPVQGPPGAIERGLIVHFLRSPKHALDAPCSPGRRDDHPGVRMRSLAHAHHVGAAVLCRTIRRWPELLMVYRGLDVASLESDGPLWLAGPAMQQVRQTSIEVAARARHPGVQPMRLTLHVGESYRCLLSGLRAVYEPFAWSLLQHGDRLGHACALLADVDAWQQEHPTVHQPRLERLVDLLSLLHASRHLHLDLSGSLLDRARSEVTTHAAHLWRGSVDDLHVDHCVDWWSALCSPVHHQQARVLGKPGRPNTRAPTMTWALLGDPTVTARAFEVVETETQHDAGAWEALRRRLIQRLNQGGHVIEINPSSNMLIGGRRSVLEDHPLPRSAGAHERPSFVLGADDPLSFATSLSDEMAYLWAALLHDQRPEEEILARLERAAKTSWRHRFTLPRSPVHAALAAPWSSDRRRALSRRPGS